MSKGIQEHPLFLVATFAVVILASVIGGYFISLPHHAGWVDQWGLYTLWLTVGIPAAGFLVCVLINEGREEELDTGLLNPFMWLFWLVSVVLLVGYLISMPHTGGWLMEWFWITVAGAFGIVFLVASLFGSDAKQAGGY